MLLENAFKNLLNQQERANIAIDRGGGWNSSLQYGNMGCCRRQNPGSATVNIVRIAVLLENKKSI